MNKITQRTIIKRCFYEHVFFIKYVITGIQLEQDVITTLRECCNFCLVRPNLSPFQSLIVSSRGKLLNFSAVILHIPSLPNACIHRPGCYGIGGSCERNFCLHQTGQNNVDTFVKAIVNYFC